MADGILSGLRVADFSRVLAGPYATMTLADFGADVVKIESPAGDDTRSWRPPVDEAGESTYFGAVNRNKRSVVCDLGTPEGLAAARALAETADVVVENFRPGVMERFGLDEDSLRPANPGLIYCSITGFGREEGAGLPGYDLLVQAVGGLMSITGAPDGEPSKVGVALVDVLTGQNALAGILLALRERDSTGLGSRVDVDLLGSLLAALTNQASSTLATGRSPAGSATRTRASHRTSCSARPTGSSCSRWATTGSSPRSPPRSASRSSRPTPASRPTRSACTTAPRCGPCWSPRSPPAPPPTGWPYSAPRASRPGSSTASARRSRSPTRSGSIR